MKPVAELSCAWERNDREQATSTAITLSGTACQAPDSLEAPHLSNRGLCLTPLSCIPT